MVARGLRFSALGIEFAIATLVAGVITLLAIAGVDKLGTIGFVLPLAAVVTTVLISRPLVAVGLRVGITILAEGGTFGLFNFTGKLYEQAFKDVTILDLIVLLAVASVAVDVLRSGRAIWIPRPLALPLLALMLAMMCGLVVAHAAGVTLHFAIFAENILAYLLWIPIAVANLDINRKQITWLLGILMGLAIFKALLGVIVVVGHMGASIEGSSTLSYYEPAANWLIMIALLSVAALALMRFRAKPWIWLGTPLLLASLVLSYRRSFWIATILGLMLLLLLGSTSATRKALVPAVLAIIASIWLIGSINFQSQAPVVKRLATLAPSKLEANAEDRYRLDERANVLGNIKEHPIEGLGIDVPWKATVRPLPIEHEDGREYVHFAALWYWMKLGILGLWAYIMIIGGAIVLSWQAWRASREPYLRGFALASMCGALGLIAMDTTASFTGVDPRFTILFAAQLGLLARLKRTADEQPSDEADSLFSGAAARAVGAAGAGVGPAQTSSVLRVGPGGGPRG
jgi:O-Antigen ligase